MPEDIVLRTLVISPHKLHGVSKMQNRSVQTSKREQYHQTIEAEETV
jgi:hypothetical protein